MTLPTNRTINSTSAEHVSDHNTVHGFYNTHPADPAAHSGTYVAKTGDESVAGHKSFTDMVYVRTNATTGKVTGKAAGDTADGAFNLLYDGDFGYIFHLTTGANSVGFGCIGIGIDAGSGNGILISQKVGSTGNGIQGNQRSAAAPMVFLQQLAANAAPVLKCYADNSAVPGQNLFEIANSVGNIILVAADTGKVSFNTQTSFNVAPLITATSMAMGDGTTVDPTINISGAAGSVRRLRLQSAGATRWAIQATNIAESGSNAGSDLEIQARDDAGSGILGTWTFTRANLRFTLPEAGNIAVGTTTGTIIGTSASQKLGFFAATPVVQRPSTTDIKQVLVDLGFLVGSGATGLNLNGGNLFTSGSVTGTTQVQSGSNSVAGVFSINGPAASNRTMALQTAGVTRWNLRANATGESGSDAGSDFVIEARADAGTLLSTPITITRSTGKITLATLLSTLASATAGAGLRLPHGAAPTSPVDGDMWTTTAGLFVRINGATVGPLS